MTIYTICDTKVDCNILEQIKYDADGRDSSYYLLLNPIWKDIELCNKLIMLEENVNKALYKLKDLEDRYIEKKKDSDIYNGLVGSVNEIEELSKEISTNQYVATGVKDLFALSRTQEYLLDVVSMYKSSSCIDFSCTSAKEDFNSKFRIGKVGSYNLVEFFISFFVSSSDNDSNVPLNMIHDVYNSLCTAFDLFEEIEEYSCSYDISA